MGNYNRTELTCNDVRKFTEIMKSISFKKSNITFQKDGIAFIVTKNTIPNKEIMQLSKGNQDLIFTAKYSFELENHSTAHIVQYANGESMEVGLMANYCVEKRGQVGYQENEYIKLTMGDSYDKLLGMAKEIFKRVDITKENETGEKYIDFVDGITLTVEDENYQMQLSKDNSHIKIIKCLKKDKETTTKLVPVEGWCPF